MVRLVHAVYGLFLSLPATTAAICGYKFGPCTSPGATCTPVLPWCKDLSRCIGQCLSTTAANDNSNSQLQQNSNFYQPCGGMVPVGGPGGGGGRSCPSWARCMSDPRVQGCGVACDGAGICVPKRARQCGGFQGLGCPGGQQCFDDPTDTCDPASGGADCTGICLVPLPKTTTPTPPTAAAATTKTIATSPSPSTGKVVRRHKRARLE